MDIFAKRGTPINSSTYGIVLYEGDIRLGGRVILILGPKWRLHYYAHLDTSEVSFFEPVSPNTRIGNVGDSGNAKGKPPHLHYTIESLFPYFWLRDKSIQGWKKMFYLNPIPYLNAAVG